MVSDTGEKLTWRLSRDLSPHWLPRAGKPVCVWDWLSQKVIKTIAFLPVYTAVVATITMCLYIFGVPFVAGR